ncbi:hypothetical protein VTK73DRAFT_5707 [Phialemonium thermophilum]|uniref:Uncharacterized protein n=1 Tax=Phialemonium thermophilum TaxID=223376 RepID=A0ABR3V1M2_9PEZI
MISMQRSLSSPVAIHTSTPSRSSHPPHMPCAEHGPYDHSRLMLIACRIHSSCSLVGPRSTPSLQNPVPLSPRPPCRVHIPAASSPLAESCPNRHRRRVSPRPPQRRAPQAPFLPPPPHNHRPPPPPPPSPPPRWPPRSRPRASCPWTRTARPPRSRPTSHRRRSRFPTRVPSSRTCRWTPAPSSRSPRPTPLPSRSWPTWCAWPGTRSASAPTPASACRGASSPAPCSRGSCAAATPPTASSSTPSAAATRRPSPPCTTPWSTCAGAATRPAATPCWTRTWIRCCRPRRRAWLPRTASTWQPPRGPFLGLAQLASSDPPSRDRRPPFSTSFPRPPATPFCISSPRSAPIPTTWPPASPPWTRPTWPP